MRNPTPKMTASMRTQRIQLMNYAGDRLCFHHLGWMEHTCDASVWFDIVNNVKNTRVVVLNTLPIVSVTLTRTSSNTTTHDFMWEYNIREQPFWFEFDNTNCLYRHGLNLVSNDLICKHVSMLCSRTVDAASFYETAWMTVDRYVFGFWNHLRNKWLKLKSKT